MSKKTNIHVSRDKLYSSLLEIKSIYGSFEHLCVYVGYIPTKGISLHVNYDYKIDRRWLNKEVVEVSDCLDCKDIFVITENIALKIEKWLKDNHYKIYERENYYE